ncbi:MAG TPA: glycosyltransferase family 4 protein [Ramlibacter sp.]|nr:glycosyltransferase family 4 protein [Ramlibacter sp.]
MKIAQVAPLYESVPPRAYGGTERVVSYLTEALVQMGHEVTLFASGDSVTSASLVSVVPRGLRLDPAKPDPLVWHTIMMDTLLKSARSFDIIHFHTDVLQLALVGHCKTPALSTAHGRLDVADLKSLFSCFPDHPMVSISNSQRAPLPWLNWRATVHHGLPLGLYSLHEAPQDYFAFVGRISPEKRADRAIEIARACGKPLRIAAKVDAADKEYFESTIEPLLDDPMVAFEGEIGDGAKNDFIGNALALLMPIDWPEPFGLVMIEAMACGTPVIAYGNGSVPEIIDHGVTGFIVDSQEQAIAAARNIGQIDRRRCRQVFEQRFSARVMARRYLDVYHELADARLPGTRVAA